MSADLALLKLGLSSASLLKSALSPDEKGKLENKTLDAIEKAKEKFYEKYGEQYGNDKNSFLVNRDNETIILNSIFCSAKFPDFSDISPKGFDGVPNASPEAILDFLEFLNAEIRKDFELDKHFKQKELFQGSSQIQELAIALKEHSLAANENIQGQIDILSQEIISSPGEIINYGVLDGAHQKQINYSRELLKKNKIHEALDYLKWLEKDMWAAASSLARFRITTNIGAAYMALGETKKAANKLIQALQYNPDDELASCNAAQAFWILADVDNARTQANKTLELNPSNSTACSILVQLGPGFQTLNEFIQKIPTYLLDSPEVAFAISIQYRKSDDFDNAEIWLQRALANDTKNWGDLRAALGGIIIEKAMTVAKEWGYQAETLPEDTREDVNKGIALLTEAWEQVVNTDVAKAHSDWLYNRSLAFLLLGRLSEAIYDIEQALLIKEKDDIIYLKLLARYTLLNGDHSKTLEILDKIKDSPEVPEALLLKAEVLKKTDPGAAENELLRFLNSSKFIQAEMELQRLTRRLLFQIYLKQENFKDARALLIQSKKNDQDYILHIVDWSKIDRLEKKETGSYDSLKDLATNLPNGLSPQVIIEIADELYLRELFELASSLYEQLVKVPQDNSLTESLLLSYYRGNLSKKALELSLNILDSQGPVRLATNIACNILMGIGDYPKARELYSTYLAIQADDYEVALRRAILDCLTQDIVNLRKFLSQNIPFNLLNVQDGIAVAQLFFYDGQVSKGIDLLYQLRRKFYSSTEIHRAYLTSLYGKVPEKEPWLSPKIVTNNVAVCIKDETDTKSWYIIEDGDADISKREISLNHPLAFKLLNKKIGAKVLLSETRMALQYGYIIDIISKYIYALNDSQAAIGKVFESIPGFESIHLGSEANNDASDSLGIIKKLVSDRANKANNIEQEYSDGRISLGIAAKLAGVRIIDVWSTFIKNKGILCCSGNSQEFEITSFALNNAKVFILDLSSILTIHALKMDRVLLKTSKCLVVAQSTLDELYETIEQVAQGQNKQSLRIGLDGDNFIKQEVTTDQIKSDLIYLKRLVNWCNKNCNIVPCYDALELKHQDRMVLVNILSKCFAESLLVARREDGILISDDQISRGVASHYKVESAWSHALIIWLFENTFISIESYNKTSLQLIQMKYRYIPINSEIVTESAKIANWSTISPFTEVIEVLRGDNSEINTAFQVALGAISDIWLSSIELEKKEVLMEAILRELFIFREQTAWRLFVLKYEEILMFRPSLRNKLREITVRMNDNEFKSGKSQKLEMRS